MQFQTPLTLDVLPVYQDYLERYDHPYLAKVAFKTATRVYWRTQIAASQDNKCIWCQCEMTHERGHAHSVTIEHMIPVSAGGANHPDNYAVACFHCNNRRGSMPAEQFRQRLAAGKPLENRRSSSARRRKIFGIFNDVNAGLTTEQRVIANKTRPLEQQYEILQKMADQGDARTADKIAAMKAVLAGGPNPYKPNTRLWRQFERFSTSPRLTSA